MATKAQKERLVSTLVEDIAETIDNMDVTDLETYSYDEFMDAFKQAVETAKATETGKCMWDQVDEEEDMEL